MAIEQYEIWAEAAFVVGAQERLTMAQLYYQLERKDDSLRSVKLGISEAEAKGILPKESFWAPLEQRSIMKRIKWTKLLIILRS